MINREKIYSTVEDLSELSEAELKAFKTFLYMELGRHYQDIEKILKTIGLIEEVFKK